MARTTSALFVPVIESLLLSLVCSFLLHGFFSSLVPADYTPSMRAVLTCTLIINIATVVLHLAVAASHRVNEIVSEDSSSPSPWSFHQALGIANAQCCASCALLLLYLLMFLQVAALSADLDSDSTYQRGAYESTHASDWKQAVVGSAGEWQPVAGMKNMFRASAPEALPLIGSIYGGILMAFLLVMFFVSIYAVFMAMPESTHSYIFLEARFLILLGGVVVLVGEYAVPNAFVHCYCEAEDGCFSPAVLCMLFAIFAALVCFLDIIIALLIPASLYSICRLGVNLIFAMVAPFSSIILQRIPNALRIAAWVIAAAAVLMGVLEYVFLSPNNSREEEPAISLPAQEAEEPSLPVHQQLLEKKLPQKNIAMFQQLAGPMRDAWIINNNNNNLQQKFASTSNMKKHHEA